MDRNYPGPCASCCTCPTPELAVVSRSASKSKSACGFLKAADGKYYQSWNTVTTSNGTCTVDPAFAAAAPGYNNFGSWSETTTTNRTATCAGITTTCSFVATSSESLNDGASPPFNGSTANFTGSADQTGTSSSAGCSPSVGVSTSEVIFPHVDGTPDQTYTYGYYQRQYDGATGEVCTESDNTTDTYSSEYTTSQLETDTLSALPAWGALPAFGGAGAVELASAELSTGEATYSVMESKYQWAHQVPPTGQYELTWVERFTPDGGGSPTDTPQTYTWDGTTPSGYNPADSTTWPKSAVFEVDYPASNGTISIHLLTYNCGAGPVTLFS